MRDYKIGIALLEVNSGYERKIFSSEYTDIASAINQVNKVISEKFGSDEQLELTRRHKRNRR